MPSAYHPGAQAALKVELSNFGWQADWLTANYATTHPCP